MINIVKWVATFAMMIGAYWSSINYFPANIIILMFGTSGLLIAALVQKDKQYTLLNMVFICIYITGVIKLYV